MRIKKMLAWAGVSVALAAPVSVAIPVVVATPASASHGYDTYESVSCGMAGGAGTVRTTVYLDYSASLASFRIDRVKVENQSARTVTVDMLWRPDIYNTYPQLNNLVLPPGTSYNDQVFHNSWWKGLPHDAFQHVRAEYFWGSYQTEHDIFPKWSPAGECTHLTNAPDND